MAADGLNMGTPRGPTVLRVCTLGVERLDRFGMENRQAKRLSGRPPGSPKPRVPASMSNAKLYDALRGSLLGACLAVQDQAGGDAGAARDRLIALVRAQRLAVKLVERIERLEGREVRVVEDDRDISRIRLPADAGIDSGSE